MLTTQPQHAQGKSPQTNPHYKLPFDKKSVLSEYSDVFTGIGQFPGNCTIHINPDVQPVVNPPRKVPIALRDKLKAELERMVQAEVIVEVNEPTPWVNSLVVVEKASGKLRVCLDPQGLNKAIRRPHYPMKTLEEILPDLSRARYFTKLDARSGYWALKLLTTFNSPFGRYRFLRMPFGVQSAQNEFKCAIDSSYEGLTGVNAIVDDILVSGKTRQEHDENLRVVLDRTRSVGTKLNDDKLEVGVTSVCYCGHLLSETGLQPDPEKVAAVRDMKPPRDKGELVAILGMINYLAKFAPNLSQVTNPLRSLLPKDIEFVWESQQMEAFQNVKNLITQSPVLAYFDPDEPVTLKVDASKYSLGASLLQHGKPVAYASKSLTPSEVQYAQIEKEMFAILYGCKRFHQYLYGRLIDVESDHKPLESILKKPIGVAPARLQRMMLQLQKYNVSVRHVPGKQISVANALSRKFVPDTYPELPEGMDVEVHTVVSNLPVSSRRMDEIRQHTMSDPQMATLTKIIQDGWPDQRRDCPLSIIEYWNLRDEMTVIDGINFKGTKIVIPTGLRTVMLDLLHSGHMGVEKCRSRAKDIMFWPGLSSDISDLVLNCPTCLELRNSNAKEPMLPREISARPWQIVATDLFAWNDQDFVVVVDYHSRYFEVSKLSSTTSATVISKLKEVFSGHGIPEKLFSDNGPQYSSEKFR
ncbi:uncharacterized protein K02A2.6-like [Mizuhopecten yessoensis]|uniref:uncharacterized protein K02A2.6-like n=1 Tax=Mizuhopecten yessoensis TaxID=6573 RepID=UPI000B45D117|nr:uncharacterized protein K02A2.6-like [Mizuhopecten yessoensis]